MSAIDDHIAELKKAAIIADNWAARLQHGEPPLMPFFTKMKDVPLKGEFFKVYKDSEYTFFDSKKQIRYIFYEEYMTEVHLDFYRLPKFRKKVLEFDRVTYCLSTKTKFLDLLLLFKFFELEYCIDISLFDKNCFGVLCKSTGVHYVFDERQRLFSIRLKHPNFIMGALNAYEIPEDKF
jgi:hypothetical protein